MKTVTLKIQRFDPEKDQRPYWAEYRVSVEDSDRLLDALHTIKWEQDGFLTFRRPRDIPITDLIEQIKRAALYGSTAIE